MRTRCESILPLLVLGAMAATACADLYTEETGRTTYGGKTHEIRFKYWYTSKGKRTEEESDVQHSITLWRWDAQEHIVIDLRKKTWRKETLEEWKATSEAAKKANTAHFEEMVKEIEAKQGKEEADKARRGFGLLPVKYTVEAGEKEEVLGHSCTKYRLMRDGELLGVYWFTTEIDPGACGMEGRLKVLDVFSPGEACVLRSCPGVMLKHTMGTAEEGIEVVEEVTKASTDAVDPSVWELPPGMTRVQPQVPPEGR